MHFKTEEIDTNTKALFVYKKNNHVVSSFHSSLSKYQVDIHTSPYIPKNIPQYKYLIVFDDLALLKRIREINISRRTQVLFIFFGKKKEFEKISAFISKINTINIKIVNLGIDNINSEMLEKVLWFLLSDSQETSLNLETSLHTPPIKKPTRKISFNFDWKHLKTKVGLYVVLLLLTLQFFFIIPTTIAGLLIYKSATELAKTNVKESQKYAMIGAPFLEAAKNSYQLARPLFSVFYLAIVPDGILGVEDNTYSLIVNSTDMMVNSQNIAVLMLKKNKNQNEQALLESRLAKFEGQLEIVISKISNIKQYLNIDNEFVTNIKIKLSQTEELAIQFKKIFSQKDELFGATSPKKYLLLFENNMELRPGGGFIGSYAILTFDKYTLTDLRVEDVYDADGQLVAHVEPPAAIKKYLNQPHWFLRDSNFSPDFPENVNSAYYFLEKEMGYKNFDGTVALTTTAINYILESYGDVYLADFNETINKNNFYIKTQTHAEKGFFPGSTQKKGFLSSLISALIIKIQDVSYEKMGMALKKSLEEKHIVMYFKNPDLNQIVEQFSWSGKVIVPKCANQNSDCLLDVVMPIDANLGVNKANFFLSRLINQKIRINNDGEIQNNLTITYKNESPLSVFPGGTYKNYFQIYLPRDITIDKVTKDNVLIDEYEKNENPSFSIVSFYFEIPPKTISEIKINYRLNKKLIKGRSSYQLIIQKQIGSANNDLILEFYFPNNVYVLNKNFSALVKDNSLIYNTNLSTDKIFFIDLSKE